MLQIASGRLFTRPPGQRNELRGVLYTNLRMYDTSIETAAGRLLSTSTLHDSKTLIYEFTEFMEDEHGVGAISSYGIDPYLSDFAAVVSFALNVTCTPDHDLTLRLLNGRPGPSVQFSPNRLIDRVFQDMVWCQRADEVQLFELVGQLISLERRNFLAAMRAIRSYVTGLHRLADDYELAYTLLVVSIESLLGKDDDSPPVWADFDKRKRLAVDNALTGADEDLASRVRQALLDTDHPALLRRFREFTLNHVKRSYFRDEARGLVRPLGRSDMVRALNQAYDLRSRYVHALLQLPDVLKLPGLGHSTLLEREPVLTFQGLARLAQHVITTFIERQPKVHREEYDYRLERSGVVNLELDPRYWVGRADNLHNRAGRRRLEGFLKLAMVGLLEGPAAPVPDLRGMLEQVEKMLPQMNAEQRRPFIALYMLFNLMVLRDGRMENYAGIVQRYGHELDGPSVESMLTFVLLGDDAGWTLAQHQAVHDAYFQQKSHQNGLRVPSEMEAGVCLTLAELYRVAGDIQRAKDLITAAVENHPGHLRLIKLENEFDPSEEITWKDIILPRHGNDNDLVDPC